MSKESRTTQQLVLRIHGGDQDAFNQLFMRYYPRIKLLVRLHMMDRLKGLVEPDDVIQELYIEVFRNFHKFEYRDPDSFYKWTVKVLGWKLQDLDKYHFKAAKRRAGDTVSLQDRVGSDQSTSEHEVGDRMPGYGTTPSQVVIEKEGYQMLEKALRKLPEHYRRVICLRQIEQRSAKETAEILEMTPNAVNVLFHRAQQKLHDLLKEMSYFKP